MNIIFGRETAEALAEKYTVLELDTIKVGDNKITAFCAVETVPIMEMPKLASMKTLHENLIIEYRKRNWNYCIQAMEHLSGFWNHELDTFYNSLKSRIDQYTQEEPAEDWDGSIDKNPS